MIRDFFITAPSLITQYVLHLLSFIFLRALLFTYRRVRFFIKKPKRIILVRHAESMGNVDTKVYSTTPDHKIELTEKGKRMSFETGKKLKRIIGKESTYWFVSPYKRAKQTFKGLSSPWGGEKKVKWREEIRLREQEWGNLQDFKTIKQTMKTRREFGSFFYRFVNGESGADVYDRVSIFLNVFHRKMRKGFWVDSYENVIIVSHGYTIRCFLARWFNWNVDILQGLWNPKNLQCVVMEKQGIWPGYYKIVTELKVNDDVKIPERDINIFKKKKL